MSEEDQLLIKLRNAQAQGGTIVGGKKKKKKDVEGLSDFRKFAAPLYEKGLSRDKVIEEWRKEHPKDLQAKREKAKIYREEVKSGKRVPVKREKLSTAQKEQKIVDLKLKAARKQLRQLKI